MAEGPVSPGTTDRGPGAIEGRSGPRWGLGPRGGIHFASVEQFNVGWDQLACRERPPWSFGMGSRTPPIRNATEGVPYRRSHPTKNRPSWYNSSNQPAILPA